MQRLRSRASIATVVAAAALGTAGTAVAQADSPPIAKAPGTGKVLKVGSQPIFKVVDNGTPYNHSIYIAVAKSKKLDRSGRLAGWTATGMDFDHMKRVKSNLWTYKTPKQSFPAWFMNHPGTYYWQAEAITSATRSGYFHTKIVKFTVR